MKNFLLLALFFITSSLYGALGDKSAIFYYGKDFSYPMVGIHNYIVTKEKNIDTHSYGYKLYKEKIYIRVMIDSPSIKIKKVLKKLLKKGYKNFFIEVKTKEFDSKLFITELEKFHKKHSNIKLILEADSKIVDKVYPILNAVVVEDGLKQDVTHLLQYGIDIIDIEFEDLEDKESVKDTIKKIKKKEMIPYVTYIEMKEYGYSSKNALKREVLTLIDESSNDRMISSAHRYGALPLEYNGYIQKLYDVSKGLPSLDSIDHYAGVVIWLGKYYKSPSKLIEFIEALKDKGIKVAFVNSFWADMNKYLLNSIGIDISYHKGTHKEVVYKDKMIGFEMQPLLTKEYTAYYKPDNAKPLVIIKDENGYRSTPAAITPWGGYVMREAGITTISSNMNQSLWIVNPFLFFEKALRLKKLLVPDTTTENGNRILFTHADGDGVLSVVESDPRLSCGDMVYKKILTKYKIPHSISVLQTELPKKRDKASKKHLKKIAQKIYELHNVEPSIDLNVKALRWNHKKEDEKLFQKETPKLIKKLKHERKKVEEDYLPRDEKLKLLFWSGGFGVDKKLLYTLTKLDILNINGGDTTITNAQPWLSCVSPLALQRGGEYQVYSGAKNESFYTNNWNGPFWGYKKAIQTFALTNSPRRLKPIDIEYHLYAMSKTASRNALTYVFDWALKQDVIPLYTSDYISKVLDFYAISIAKEKKRWLVSGAKDLKTLRLDKQDREVSLQKSKTVVGIRKIESHSYISLDNHKEHLIELTKDVKSNNQTYLRSSNAKILSYKRGINHQRITVAGEVALKLSFTMKQGCHVVCFPQESHKRVENGTLFIEYNKSKKATLSINCK